MNEQLQKDWFVWKLLNQMKEIKREKNVNFYWNLFDVSELSEITWI